MPISSRLAFFLLLWLLGATTQKQRKGIADYFAPTPDTPVKMAGGGVLSGGAAPGKPALVNLLPQAIPPRHTGDGGPLAGTGDKGSLRTPRSIAAQDRQAFDTTRKRIAAALRHNGALRKLAGHVRFVPTAEGLRIDLVDGVDYSMFASGTTGFVREAGALIATIGDAIRDLPNPVMIRGHTDSLGYGDPRRMNNWILSAGRAETTRRQLAARGVRDARFDRIEGVADHLPLIGGNPADPRNRRVAITLLYRDAIGNR